jgi:hypothetical protein
MLVSHEHQFIFLKTTKTAGTSIEIALSEFLNHPRDVITPITPDDEQTRFELTGKRPRNYLSGVRHLWHPRALHYLLRRRHFAPLFWNHCPARWVKRHLGKRVWSHYFKFCFVRNPWDKIVSYFHMERSWNQIPAETEFKGYVLNVVVPASPMRLDWPIVSDGNKLEVDFVGRFENLIPDLREACRRVGIDFDGRLPRAKGSFREDKSHYSAYYDDETREAVGTMFHKEIETFGYTFEGAE